MNTATLVGVDASPVRVEVNLSDGLPSFLIVGLAQGSVREGRERVAAAIRNSGRRLPGRRITINLAPADVRKEGTAFDLPIALGVLAAAGDLPPPSLTDVVVLGELGLDGAVRPVSGALAVALWASDAGARTVIVPRANAREAALAPGIDVVGVGCLDEAVAAVTGGERTSLRTPERWLPDERRPDPAVGDLSDVRGQAIAKRALQIAVAGAHHLLMVGPPGVGKTMLARRASGLLSPLDLAERIEVGRIHSVAGLPIDLGPGARRPFRAPHHSVSYAGLAGGGRPLRPGEISLAHLGVLFLDELPEFRRDVLEVLRQPLESGTITVVRAAGSVSFPARFLLIAAMNPCPCGYLGDGSDRCLCDPGVVSRYRARVSGPFLDRVDLRVEMGPVEHACPERRAAETGTDLLAAGVADAVEVQVRRYADFESVRRNGDARAAALEEAWRGSGEAVELLRAMANEHRLSARAYDAVRRVARTIADLGGSERISTPHVAEALQFRLGGARGPPFR